MANTFGSDSLDDTLLGGGEADTIFGGANGGSGGGADDLDGGGDADTLYGGAGIDDLFGGEGNDDLFGGDDADFLRGGDGNDTLWGDLGDDTLHGNTGDDVAYGGDGSDTLASALGNDTLYGGAGADTVFSDRDDDDLYGGDGNDYLYADDGDDLLVGEVGDDTLLGQAGIDDLYGGLANDSLYGGLGNDRQFGGDGDDFVSGDGGDDMLTGGAGNDLLWGGNGVDYADYSSATGSIIANATTNFVTGDTSVGLDTIAANMDGVVGSAFADNLTGRSTGYFRFQGGGGNDLIQGAAGQQTRAEYADATSSVTVIFNGSGGGTASGGGVGTDTLIAITDLTGSTHGDTIDASGFAGGPLTGTDRVGVSFSLFNLIAPGAGDDVVLGNGRTYVQYFEMVDPVVGDLGAGTVVDASGGIDTLSGVYALQGSGTGNDTLTGDGAYNRLYGDAFGYSSIGGADTLFGAGGADDLYGGAAIDSMYGGGDIDFVYGGDGDDHLFGGLGNDSLAGDGGFDRAAYDDRVVGVFADLATSRATLIGTGEVDTLSSIEMIIGTIHGDTFWGAGGNEWFGVVGAGVDTAFGGGGSGDGIGFSRVTGGGVTVDIALNVVSGGSGADVIAGFEHVDGTETDDTIFGNASSNVLQGRGGDDTLYGADFRDSLYGGAADDALYGDADDDTLSGGAGNDSLDGGGGFDRVDYRSAVGTVTIDVPDGTAVDGLGGVDTFASVELFYAGDFGTSMLGGDGGDQLIMGAGADVYDGGAGVDWASFFYATAGVLVDLQQGTATGGGGADIVLNVEQVGGSAFADTLRGTDGNNYFRGDDSGSGAADTFDGRGGNDEVDYRTETTGVRADLVAGTVTNGLGVVDVLISIEGVRGTGFSDTIYGGDGDNVLFGGAGADSLFGGVGNDYLCDGSGNDFVDGGLNYDFGAQGNERLDFDTVDYSNINATGGIVAHLFDGTIAGNASVGIDTVIGVESVRGTAFADTLVGGGGARFEAFRGGGGNDIITGDGAHHTRSEYVDATGAVVISMGSGQFGSGTATGNGVGTDALSNVNQFFGSNFDDTFLGASFDFILTEENAAFNAFRGGDGNDMVVGNGVTRIEYGNSTASVVVNLVAGTASDGFGDIDTFSGVNQVVGSSAADTFYGGASSFDNMEYEGFRGGAGDDVIYGGAGEDEARYDQASDPIGVGITVNMAAQTVIGDPTWTGTDMLFSVERIVGSAQSDYYDARGFNTGDAITTFRSGALPSATFNLFNGGAGDDTIFGNGDTGLTYRSATAGVVGVFTGQGMGTVSGSGNVGTDTFLEGVYALVDTNYDDTFYGSDVDDDDGDYLEVFSLFRGDDTVYGGAGDDVVSYNNAIRGGIHADLAAGTVLGLASGIDLPWSTGLDRLYGVENVIATNAVDTLVGNDGDNGFAGLEGNDSIDGGDGFDNAYYFFDLGGVQVNLATGQAIDGAGDIDTLISIEAAVGSQFADSLLGSSGDNELSGAAGNDSIDGAGGNDELYGEDGDDRVLGGAGDDTVSGGLGVDSVDGGAGFDVVEADYEEEEVATAVVMTGAGTSTTIVSGANVATYVNIEARDIVGGSGDDSLLGGANNDRLEGGDGNDRLFGGTGADQLFGRDGIDTLNGGVGQDQMAGGAGNDVYFVDDLGDQLNETAAGSDGVDLVAVSVNNYTVGAGVERINMLIATGQTASATGVTDNVFYGGAGSDVVYGGAGGDSAIGGDGGDRLNGDLGDDALFGGLQNDTLYGGDGNDVMDGGSGNDVMAGGAGDDVYTVDSLTDVANETAPGSGGTDTINLGVVGFNVNAAIEHIYVLGLAGMTVVGGGATDNHIYGGLGDDRLNGGVGTGIDLLYGGAAQDKLFGGAGDDSLFGGAGMDSLLGEAGADFMAGGASNDVYFVDDGGDVVDETSAGSGGYDLVFVSTADYTIGEGVDRANMQLVGGGQIVAVGASNNTLSGNVGGDTFDGGDGDDLLNGVAGADSLFGGAGNDKLYGGEGTDLLEGGDGNDTLDGGVGPDQMAGGAGNDIYFANDMGDDIDEHSPGSDGFDIVFVNTALYEVDEGVERINVQFAAGISLQAAGETDNLVFGGAGNDALNGGGGIDTVVGGNGDDAIGGGTGNDRLDAGAGADSLDGGDGDDVLLGGAGTDSMSGGAGDDTYYMNQSTDVAGELAPGSDGVDLALVYQTGTSVGEGIERITVQGVAGLFVSAGGATDNTMTGGVGNDTLAAGAGNDTSFGLNGNDVLLGGSDNDVLDGGAGNDTLDGGDGLDSLLGGLGNDRLNGGLGADTLNGGGGVDVFEKHANQGNDTIADFGLGGADKVDLTGITVTSPFGAATVTFSDGTTLTAANGHLWIAGDFI